MEQIDLVWEATFYLLAVLTQLCHLTEDQKRRLYANTGCVTLYIFKKLRKKNWDRYSTKWKKLHRYWVSEHFSTQLKQFWTPGTFKYFTCESRSKNKKDKVTTSKETCKRESELRIKEKLKFSMSTVFKLNSTYKDRKDI